ncbi:MAG TPA: GTP 3',8-cyclase MoaA [Terriglobales bacterium]|nr:GTP 3',8-cyclase MoaA [Terriglobales bacterium]
MSVARAPAPLRQQQRGGINPPMPLLDQIGRPLRNLRLSVTDRCNLRCQYCMPEADYLWLPRQDLLQFEEISRLVDIFCRLGVDKLRLTGGEPLMRRDLPALVAMFVAKAALRDIALTTNGVLLRQQAEALAQAGLHRITISLDTLDGDRFLALTRRDELGHVLEGIAAAAAAGFRNGIKLDAVVMRGVNDDELFALLEFARTVPAELRFIEYMDVGGATRWSWERVVSRAEILAALGHRYGAVEPLPNADSAPADRFRLPDGTVFGIISSTTAPFCHACDRSRLTADGMWYRCLYAIEGSDLRAPLRGGASDEEIAARIAGIWRERRDRGAEERLRLERRATSVDSGDLRRDPHLEMHTRGG